MTSMTQLIEHPADEYILLQPIQCPPRTGSNFQLINPIESLHPILDSIAQSDVVAVDFETQGNDYSSPKFRCVGIGMAWDEGNCYFEWDQLTDRQKQDITNTLSTHKGLIAHNVYFDGGVARRAMGRNLPWKYCTYATYAMLANEGYAGRSWGLKLAQTDLLLWSETNETELDEWLVGNGYYRGVQRMEQDADKLIEMYRAGGLSPEKGEMWRAPADILGKYCCLDAESTYLLFLHVLRPALQRFPTLDEFIRDKWMRLIDVHITQKMCGILMDRPGLVARKNLLVEQIAQLTRDFETHPEVSRHIRDIEQEMIRDKAPQEPNRLKKNGEISKNGVKWDQRMDLINRGQDPEFRFNMSSGPQLRKLLYEKLGMDVKVLSEKGEPSVATKALLSLGGVGSILTERIWLVKELGFIEKYLELTEERNTIHPSFRTPGTSTGRLSSKEPNMQQISKTQAMMSLFIAPPGKVWVDLDFCLHPDTEYLTLRGWKKISELENTDHVWSVNPDTLVGQWEIPKRIIRRQYEGKMYLVGNRRGKLAVTENHRMLWTSQKKHDREYRHLTTYSQYGIPNTSLATIQTSTITLTGGYVPTDHELAMVCLLQADSYKTPTKGYTIQVSLPHKRKRVRELLGEDKCSQVYPPHGSQKLEVENWSNVRYSSPLLDSKSLDLSNLCSSVADKLVQELAFWDGSVGKSNEIIYGSTDIRTVESIQTYLVRCGYECKLRGHQPKYPGSKYFYTLIIRKSKGIRLRKGIDDVHSYDYIGEVGCVTVSTGYIQVRYAGQTFVTGNCALEPVVATEFSQDENMMHIYGNGRPANDVYCFVMSAIPGMAERAQSLGYDPYNPTPESLARVKKEMKRERGICKTVTLAAQYGAGVNKIHQTLDEQGISLPVSEVHEIYQGYWELFQGVKDFGKSLQYERRRNKGYVLNGLGRPMAVPSDFEKDVLNRFIQSTGHDVLVNYICLLMDNLDREGIEWKPLIMDFHDSTAVEVPEKDAERTVQVFNRTMQDLNRLLAGTIQLKGTPTVGRNLSEIKEPEN